MSSEQSLDYYPANKTHTFTVDLAENMMKLGKWYVTLTEICIPELTDNNQSPVLNIYSNICEDSIVG